MNQIRVYLAVMLSVLLNSTALAQTYKLVKGDTINRLDKDSLQQGLWQYRFVDGHLHEEILYKDGRKSGLYLEYYDMPNCQKLECTYRNDTLEGIVIHYYRSCNIRSIQNMKGGRLEGFSRSYHRNGKLESEGFFKNGELQGSFAVYDDKGRLKFESSSPETEADLDMFVNGDKPITDSSILKLMNDIPVTSRTTVVTDVTGSMYPYVGQLLLWYRLHMDSTPLRQFVFFNDGNGKLDLHKEIGKTGGIYYIKPAQWKNLRKTMATAITKGGGGDLPENDLEAVIKAAKKYKTDKIILIADRTSPVRDIALLSKVKVPVYIILCGTGAATHLHYLEIAHKTGGEVLALDNEMQGVKGIKEGQQLKIAGLYYQFHNGKFRHINTPGKDY